jgi:N-acetylmuramoyl-L-alanine amidase
MKVFIDPGHGGNDPGATSGDLVEKDLALGISLRLRDRLKASGHLVKMSRVTDLFLDLGVRASRANEWRSDVFLSIHLNADPDPDEPGMPEAQGSEFWIYPGSVKGRRLAQEIDRAVTDCFIKHPARGIKEANFAVLRRTKMPAVLLELAFIDTEKSGVLKQPDVQEALAASITVGVHKYSEGEPEAVV